MAGQLIPRGKRTWLLRVYLGRDPRTGKREYLNQTFHGTKRDAEDELAALVTKRSKGEIAAGRKAVTISDLLDDLIRDYRLNGQGIQWCETLCNVHLRPFFGKLPAAKLTAAHVNAYIDARKEKGRANATINHELSLLRRALNLGKDADKVTRAPKIPKLEENNVRKGFFEAAEYQAMRAELPEDLRPVLTFAYYTGCRRGEILGLQWPQVDLEECMIRLEPGTTKNAEPRLLPLDGELLETIRMQREIRDARCPESPWVFFWRKDGRQILNFRKSWDAAGGAAKVDKLFHDLRRTGVRNLVRAGVPEKTAMLISGHKTRAVFDRYNVTDERDLKAAMRAVSEYHRAKEPAHKGTPKRRPASNRHTIGTHGEKAPIQ